MPEPIIFKKKKITHFHTKDKKKCKLSALLSSIIIKNMFSLSVLFDIKMLKKKKRRRRNY